MATQQLHQQGLSVAEIAQQRGFAVSTINTHLSELMEMNQPVALNQLVTAEKQQAIISVIKQVGDMTLKTIKESLGEEYSYEEIRLVRGWWRSNI
jgi:ATP-dependent DNA helicase RecQ